METRPSGAGKALAGFLLSGFLLAFLGAILPAWGCHRDPPDFVAVGNYFLCLAVGLAASFKLARILMTRRGASFLLIFACLLACASLIYLALVSPPASAWWRAAGLLVLGGAAGLVNMALFHVHLLYLSRGRRGRRHPGRRMVQRGLPGGYPSGHRRFQRILRRHHIGAHGRPAGRVRRHLFQSSYAMAPQAGELTLRRALADFRSLGAVLFALLLFSSAGTNGPSPAGSPYT